ncbi:MAG: hypothetical protein AUJ85_06890 [Elusimicrobia bacterium CG1_02_37_114]|nr:MAG: hypothetical protein AUJ85_06890 [Elusimicrobia bacterium CG1_02_37_114]PIV52519.1 MAG: hypothetical protein COS17_08740 [Elusimicrobia bacterium CG02_land_8_20_14_3_00_37_13]
MANNIISQIRFEIGQIDQLFGSYSDLLKRSQESTPDLVEITAIAAVLHSFYNGVENIFLSIAKGLDEDVPKGSKWHRDLLVQMTQQIPRRSHVISEKTAQELAEYLGFRHFYRHSYSFFLKWDDVEKLVTPLKNVWTQLKRELNLFIDSLSSG